MKEQFTKTKFCPFFMRGNCNNGPACSYAHTKYELRPMPDLQNTKLCDSVTRGYVCRIDDCAYAHSRDDLRVTTDLVAFKTSLCFFHKRGKCMNGDKCRFAHGPHELNVVNYVSQSDEEELDHKPSSVQNSSRSVNGIESAPSSKTTDAYVIGLSPRGTRRGATTAVTTNSVRGYSVGQLGGNSSPTLQRGERDRGGPQRAHPDDHHSSNHVPDNKSVTARNQKYGMRPTGAASVATMPKESSARSPNNRMPPNGVSQRQTYSSVVLQRSNSEAVTSRQYGTSAAPSFSPAVRTNSGGPLQQSQSAFIQDVNTGLALFRSKMKDFDARSSNLSTPVFPCPVATHSMPSSPREFTFSRGQAQRPSFDMLPECAMLQTTNDTEEPKSIIHHGGPQDRPSPTPNGTPQFSGNGLLGRYFSEVQQRAAAVDGSDMGAANRRTSDGARVGSRRSSAAAVKPHSFHNGLNYRDGRYDASDSNGEDDNQGDEYSGEENSFSDEVFAESAAHPGRTPAEASRDYHMSNREHRQQAASRADHDTPVPGQHHLHVQEGPMMNPVYPEEVLPPFHSLGHPYPEPMPFPNDANGLVLSASCPNTPRYYFANAPAPYGYPPTGHPAVPYWAPWPHMQPHMQSHMPPHMTPHMPPLYPMYPATAATTAKHPFSTPSSGADPPLGIPHSISYSGITDSSVSSPPDYPMPHLHSVTSEMTIASSQEPYSTNHTFGRHSMPTCYSPHSPHSRPAISSHFQSGPINPSSSDRLTCDKSEAPQHLRQLPGRHHSMPRQPPPYPMNWMHVLPPHDSGYQTACSFEAPRYHHPEISCSSPVRLSSKGSNAQQDDKVPLRDSKPKSMKYCRDVVGNNSGRSTHDDASTVASSSRNSTQCETSHLADARINSLSNQRSVKTEGGAGLKGGADCSADKAAVKHQKKHLKDSQIEDGRCMSGVGYDVAKEVNHIPINDSKTPTSPANDSSFELSNLYARQYDSGATALSTMTGQNSPSSSTDSLASYSQHSIVFCDTPPTATSANFQMDTNCLGVGKSSFEGSNGLVSDLLAVPAAELIAAQPAYYEE